MRYVALIVRDSTPLETYPDCAAPGTEYAWIDTVSRALKQRTDGAWEVLMAIDNPALISSMIDAHVADLAAHAELSNLNITGMLKAGGNTGLTGTRTVGGYQFTFTKGLLTGFAPA